MTSMERTAQARHHEVNVVVDANNRHGDAMDSTKGGKMHTPHKTRRRRPDKKQRALFSEFLNEQKAKVAAQPHEFDVESVEIPTHLVRQGGVEPTLEKVKRILYAVKESLTTHSRLQ